MKINRRKYDTLVKFLKDMILTAKSERVRMQAAERLDGIYARHELYEQQALQRKDRAEIKALTSQAQGEAARAQETLLQEQQQEQLAREAKAAQERADLADFDRMLAENRAKLLVSRESNDASA
jgi:hypothetical protein